MRALVDFAANSLYSSMRFKIFVSKRSLSRLSESICCCSFETVPSNFAVPLVVPGRGVVGVVGGAKLEERRFIVASSLTMIGGDSVTTCRELREPVRPRSGVRELERTRMLAAEAPGGSG